MPNNIYIHGTTSAALPTLRYGLMSPITLLNKHMMAPMGGEITEGGLSTPKSTCDTCFALLLPDAARRTYDKEKVIKNYAQRPIDLPNKQKITKAIQECIDKNLGNINEIIVFIARAKQWGLNIQDIIDFKELEKEFHGMQQFYYALLCLTTYAKPNEINRQKIFFHERTRMDEFLGCIFKTDKFHELVRNLEIDFKEVWRNPNKNDLDKLAKIFSLPAGEYIVYPAGMTRPGEKVSVSEDLYLYTFDKNLDQNVHYSPNKKEVKNAAYTVNALIKKLSDQYELESLTYELGSSILAESLYEQEWLSVVHPFLLEDISALESRFLLMKNIIENKDAKVFTDQEKQLVLDNFPIIFVLEDESLIDQNLYHEFRVSTTLKLGKEITKVVTNNEVNKEKIQEWLKQNQIDGVQVMLIEELHPNVHTYFNLMHRENINEVLDTVCKNSQYLIDVSKYTLAELYSQSAQVGENYTIKEHTILVLQELMLHEKLFLEANSETVTLNGSKVEVFNLMSAIIALHDIGKSLGLKDKQHENTMPILKGYLEHWGFNRHEIKLAEAIVGHNLIGDLIVRSAIAKENMNDNAIANVAKQLAQKAAECGLDLWTFYKLQCLYYLSDAGSYPFIKQNYMQNTKIQKNPEIDFYDNFDYIPKSESFRKLTQAVEKLSKHPTLVLSSNAAGLNKDKNQNLPVASLSLKKRAKL